MTAAQYNLLTAGDDNNSPNSSSVWCRASAVLLAVMLAAAAISFVLFKLPPSSAGRQGLDRQHRSGSSYPPPPPHTEYASMCRYIMHISDWASLATISTHSGIEGYPFNNVFSISDGLVGSSTGTPYFYLTAMELSVHDLKKDPRVSLTASLAQSRYCEDQHLDQQDPVCAHTILTGEIVQILANSTEEAAARTALFTRHPEMTTWPTDHDWFFARLAIRHIYLLDYFGGAKVITPEQYYAASPYGST